MRLYPDSESTKTMLLCSSYNLLLAVSLQLLQDEYMSTSFKIVLGLATNLLLLYGLHELGKIRRPGSNTIVKWVSFFAQDENFRTRLVYENCLDNIANGGAATLDHITCQNDGVLRSNSVKSIKN